MLKVKDIMTTEVITVSPDAEIMKAAGILLEKRINGLPVLDAEGRLVGIICQSDLIAQQKQFPLPSVFNILGGLVPLSSFGKYEKEVQKMAAIRVADAMSSNPISVHSEMTVEEVATIMVRKNLHTIPVVDMGKLVGIIGKEDVLRTIMPSAG